MEFSYILELLEYMGNPECAEGVKRVVRIFSQERDILGNEVAAADQANDWSRFPSLFYTAGSIFSFFVFEGRSRLVCLFRLYSKKLGFRIKYHITMCHGRD